MVITKIRKRNGETIGFNKDKITNVIFKAASAVGGNDVSTAEHLSNKVINILEERFSDIIPNVEDVQNSIEEILIKNGHDKTAKAFILYRAKRAELRAEMLKAEKMEDLERKVLMKMFATKTKVSNIIGYDKIDAYKNLLFFIKDKQSANELPVHKNYLNDNELAKRMYNKKYFLKDIDTTLIEKKPEDVFARLAAFMASTESTQEKQEEWAEKYYLQLYDGNFLPGGRVIAGAGDLYRLKTLANCFVSLINTDSIEGIYNTAYECARTYSYGGGIGVDISCLRPRNAIVHNAADTSTGAVSFMELFSLTTGLIGQSGRRGAMMMTIDVKHPDSPLFINVKNISNWVTNQIIEQCKWTGNFDENQIKDIEKNVRENTQVRFANISLKISDEFMQAVQEHNEYQEKILVYSKDSEVSSVGMAQSGSVHYSHGIPSKPIKKYNLLKSFDNLDDLNDFLKERGADQISKEDLKNEKARDMFGDLIIKGDVESFAIKKAGDFMLYFNCLETGEIKQLINARDLWNDFLKGNYNTAEPGMMFWNTMSKYSPSNYVGKPIASTNPCGEVPLEDGGACNLASINLSRFVKNSFTEQAEIDWESLKETVFTVTRFLDSVVTWNENFNALDKQKKAAKETRRLGLGVMGMADMLNQLCVGYDDERSFDILENVAKIIANETYRTSAMLSEEKGPSPIFNYEKYSKNPFFREALDADVKELIRSKGLRNIAILSIAPTGSISNLIKGYEIGDKNYIGVSGGIEPVFALFYTRRSESLGNEFFKVFHSPIKAYLEKTGDLEKAQMCKVDSELNEIIPNFFSRTAHKIDPKKRIKIQAIWQKFIDHSISSTLNLPEDVNPEIISDIYIESWKSGLKGVTIYREGSRFGILTTEEEKSEFQKSKNQEFIITIDGKQKSLKGGDIITLSDGSITTVYHATKNGKVNLETIKEGGETVGKS